MELLVDELREHIRTKYYQGNKYAFELPREDNEPAEFVIGRVVYEVYVTLDTYRECVVIRVPVFDLQEARNPLILLDLALTTLSQFLYGSIVRFPGSSVLEYKVAFPYDNCERVKRIDQIDRGIELGLNFGDNLIPELRKFAYMGSLAWYESDNNDE